MSKVIDNLKKEFKEDFYFEKEFISKEEQEKVQSHEGLESEVIDGETRYYKKVYVDFNNEELQQYSMMKNVDLNSRMLNNLRMMNEKLATMKSIMMFWFILTLISICCNIYMAVKIADAFKHF